jgi:glycerol uptake facilitator-like aquaporin
LPIIAVILMLVTARARKNGPASVLGWLVGLAIVGTIVLLVAGPTGASDDGEPATEG